MSGIFLPDRSAPLARPRDLDQAARALEAILLKQLVDASGAFNGKGGAGSAVHADMFATALAEALADAGGVGIAKMIAGSIAGGADVPRPGPATSGPGRPGTARPEHLAQHLLEGGSGRVTSAFGRRPDPFDHQLRHHEGVDIAAPEGTGVRAIAGGVVRSAGERGAFGNAVEIDHGGGVTTLYAHASEVLVRPGEKVEKGQEIAKIGSTGRATGPHLHFEVRVGDRPTNPSRALNAYGLRAD
ncbi:MAG TPA: peptidoglycan DD-metalloendopeptidase family protein [Vulgatibacter sp.]|nr:peptidoglycan DD-metalloendopeptidase family protein [Vulgatibacter sp.]